jgi:CBS domain-containing protein
VRIEDRMHAAPRVVPRDTPLSEAGGLMVREHIRHLPVVDVRGALCGMLTDHAVFRCGAFLDGDRGWIAHEPQFDACTAGSEAVPVDVTAAADAPLHAVLSDLASTRQDAVVVVDASARPIGVLTEHDVVLHALEHLAPDVVALDWGTVPVLTAERLDPAATTLAGMLREGGRHRVVTEPDGSLHGVVSLRDLVSDDAPRRPELTTEAALRSDRPHALPLDATLREVVGLMKAKRIGCVPLLDRHRQPVAVVTRRDVMRAVTAELGGA